MLILGQILNASNSVFGRELTAKAIQAGVTYILESQKEEEKIMNATTEMVRKLEDKHKRHKKWCR